MVGNGKAPIRDAPFGLVGIIACGDWFYAFGDPDRAPIHARPIARPRILHSLPFTLPYDALTLALEQWDSRPRGANAFAIGRPVVASPLDVIFDAGVQYYRLDVKAWHRAQSMKPKRAPLVRYLADCDTSEG